jgi:hypothetical protein
MSSVSLGKVSAKTGTSLRRVSRLLMATQYGQQTRALQTEDRLPACPKPRAIFLKSQIDRAVVDIYLIPVLEVRLRDDIYPQSDCAP